MNSAAKIAGWILLVAGISLIGWTLLSSYNIFTAEAMAPQFFSSSAESYGGPTEALGEGGETPGQLQQTIQQMIGEQLKGIFPVDSITKLLNLAVWSLLAFILIFGGTQISNIGINLIKK